MNRDEIRDGLERCVAGLEASLEAARERHERQVAQLPSFMSVPFEMATDTNARPIAADIYAALGACYTTLTHLTEGTT